MDKGRKVKFMVIRLNRESARRWTRHRVVTRAISPNPLNEHGWALNAFWLPVAREEGVRRAEAKACARQTGLAPGPDVTRWHQMGD